MVLDSCGTNSRGETDLTFLAADNSVVALKSLPMGLLTILKKIRTKEREMRILMLYVA